MDAVPRYNLDRGCRYITPPYRGGVCNTYNNTLIFNRLENGRMSAIHGDNHKNECENAEYYYCSTDTVMVHESEKNICPTCSKFIPRFDKVTDCICEELVKYDGE